VKRVDDVVRIFDLVRQQIPCKLLLVGDGPERGRIENLCRELKVCNHTHFLGKLKNVEQVYSVADLFLLPSETESFGLSALEALTGGVPVISSDTGGIPEVNVHGVTGYLSPVGDVQGMADHAISLLKDPEKMDAFRINAMAQADRFSKSAIIPQYEALYRKVIEKVKS
jgi:N-acetyl-alpha-D-glucosaminyl L-malate synthase BshA